MDEMISLLTSEAVAKYLNVEVITVRRLVKSGKLAAYRIGGEYRFSQEDLQTYLQNSYQPAQRGILEHLGILKGNVHLRRLTQRAKSTVAFAVEEARTLNHPTVHFEHLLVGLVREQEGLAGKVLTEQGITLKKMQDTTKSRLGIGAEEPPDCLALHPGVKQLMEEATAQAKKLQHNYVGTEHLLLAFLDADTADLIQQININPVAVRQRIRELITTT